MPAPHLGTGAKAPCARKCAEAVNATGVVLAHASYHAPFVLVRLNFAQSACLLSKVAGYCWVA